MKKCYVSIVFVLLSSCGLASEGLPNKSMTPGVINPEVIQENINETICVVGWTKTIRPSSAYTSNLKARQIAEYGYVDTNKDDYEEDHLIPLSLGGHPRDKRNLWPQPKVTQWNAIRKDRLEKKLHYQVCAQILTLKEAQEKIGTNWVKAYKEAFN